MTFKALTKGLTKGITKRWLLNTVGVILGILIILEIGFVLVVRSFYYNNVRQNLLSHMNTIISSVSPIEFEANARELVENFSHKDQVEVMIINRHGEVFITSSGFIPQTNDMIDYDSALTSPSNSGEWSDFSSTGENVMARTNVFRKDGEVVGAVRLVVSLESVDRHIVFLVLIVLAAGIALIFMIILSGTYFISSIVTPVREIGVTAKNIACGDFDSRINKKYDDEIGELCETINHMADELSASEKIKNDFISSVSHELRTPLTAIKGWGETLLDVNDDPIMTKKGLDVIIKESERLSGIVEELLDFSRMQNGRINMMMDKLDILAELSEAVFIFNDRSRRENIELIYNEPYSLPPVFGDKNRLRQVFVNILDNAFKYSNPGDTIIITASRKESNIYVFISDNGCGIPKKHLPRVKEKFYKGNHNRRGSGIGLALADEIVSLHSGSLLIDSAEGVGTTVTIVLPVSKKDEPIL